MSDHRDHELGNRLRSLEVPGHSPDFWDRLDQRLDAVAPPSLRSAPTRGKRSRMQRAAFAATAVAAAVAIFTAVVVGVGRPGDSPLAPSQATAEEVTERMMSALSSMGAIEADVVEVDRTQASPITTEWRLLLTEAGDMRVSSEQFEAAYDADDGSVRTVVRVDGDVYASEEVGVAPGPPDHSAPSVIRRQLSAAVRALAHAGDARVSETTHEGRQVWRLEGRVDPNRIGVSADHVVALIDQRLALPLEIVERRSGEVIRTLRLRVAGTGPSAVQPHELALAFPEGEEVGRVDYGFRRMSLSEVADRVGYDLLVPAFLPEGFERAEVAFADAAQPTGSEGLNPVSDDVVSVGYRRGFEQVVVTTRQAAEANRWSDPFGIEGRPITARTVVLRSGALDGARARLVVDAASVPHLWLLHDGLLVTVAGDLTPQQLVAVAESLSLRTAE